MIYLGADHAGFYLKEEIKEYFDESGQAYEDLGAFSIQTDDDFPDFAAAVAKKVAETGEKGILICGTGLGMCMVANKIKGVRAAAPYETYAVQQSIEHLDANVLCLGGKVIDIEKAKQMIETWLGSKFSGKTRHSRRLKKMEEIEKSN